MDKLINLKAVIGANYGDEGKGLTTAYLASRSPEKPVIVLSNGGAQRGHTVETTTGFRHVFSHLGSCYDHNAVTYMPSTYIVNPIVFCSEVGKLGGPTLAYANRDCLVTTPYDMLFNRILETNRGHERHGSTGMGIWATIDRHSAVPIKYGDLGNEHAYNKKLDAVVSWYSGKFKELGLDVSKVCRDLFSSKGLRRHFLDDSWDMWNTATPVQELDYVLNHYSPADVIFEGAQGLLLSDNPNDDHTTPSKTGIDAVDDILSMDLHGAIEWNSAEVYYVTRPYITRHGAGPLEGECPVDMINTEITETTNVPNEWQGSMRYALMDWKKFNRRIKADFSKFSLMHKGAEGWVSLTHYDETPLTPNIDAGLLVFSSRYADQDCMRG